MKILSINTGSSSLKFSLFEMNNEEVIASGLFERIGLDGVYTIKYQGQKIKEEVELKNHTDAVKILLEKLISLEIIKSLDEIDGVGHRLVHGKDKYASSVVITDEVVNDLLAFKDFAPLHNPANVLGIEAFREVLPNVLMVGVFDTAFHQTMDKETYLYPVPYEWYTKYGVRKYGFHGTSHRYITETLTKELGRKDLKIISCHIGNGGSITAVKDGKCVDTSMGFTPLAGIMMGTRSGDVDPSIIPYVMEQEGLNASEVVNALNKKSGLSGMSGLVPDFREIEIASNEGQPDARIAVEDFNYTIASYVAKYAVAMNGVDYIIFTGGIGENQINIRKGICKKLEFMGVKLDLDSNNMRGEEKVISTPDSKIKVYVIPTNEELMIAKETLRLVK